VLSSPWDDFLRRPVSGPARSGWIGRLLWALFPFDAHGAGVGLAGLPTPADAARAVSHDFGGACLLRPPRALTRWRPWGSLRPSGACSSRGSGHRRRRRAPPDVGRLRVPSSGVSSPRESGSADILCRVAGARSPPGLLGSFRALSRSRDVSVHPPSTFERSSECLRTARAGRGQSAGPPGVLPRRISAARVTTGCFDLAFQLFRSASNFPAPPVTAKPSSCPFDRLFRIGLHERSLRLAI
jgi:hypothetical protein